MATKKNEATTEQIDQIVTASKDTETYEALKEENAALRAKYESIMRLIEGGKIGLNSVATEVPAEVAEAEAKNKEMSELVERTYYSRNNNEKDIKVGVNGKVTIIKLGEPVKIPKYVAEVIEHSYEQIDKTQALIDDKTKEKADTEEKYT